MNTSLDWARIGPAGLFFWRHPEDYVECVRRCAGLPSLYVQYHGAK